MGRIHVVIGFAVNRLGRVLFLQRATQGAFPSLWELPGGKIQDSDLQGGRNLTEIVKIRALKREWKEELGLDIEVGDLITTCRFLWEDEVFVYAYRVKIPHGPFQLLAGQQDFRYLTMQEAMKDLCCVPSFYWMYRHLRSHILMARKRHRTQQHKKISARSA